MEKIRIITDSASDILSPYPDNLTVLPLNIRFGEDEYLDGVTIDHQEFFRKLENSKSLPTTSLISPAVFEESYEKAMQSGETVIAILLSSKLSGTYQSAILAAEEYENVFVIDSLNATLGLQILVRYALQLVDQDKPAEEIVTELERVKSHIRLMGMPDTLEYLRRGGRISGTVAFVGSALSIKPILKLEKGEIVMLGKARGSRNGFSYMLNEIEKMKGFNSAMPFCLGYTGISDALFQQFLSASGELWNTESPIPVSTVGATIGTHVGPDAIVIAFFENF